MTARRAASAPDQSVHHPHADGGPRPARRSRTPTAAARCARARRLRRPGPARRVRPRKALDEHLGPGEQRHHRRHDHHGDAPPQRPGVEDVRAAEQRRALRRIAPARRLDLCRARSSTGTTITKSSTARASRLAAARMPISRRRRSREVERGGERELADVHAGELRQRREALLDQRVVPGVEVVRQVATTTAGRATSPAAVACSARPRTKLHAAASAAAAASTRALNSRSPRRRARTARPAPRRRRRPSGRDAARRDEAPLHRERHQHAQDRQHDGEADDLPRRQHAFVAHM